jgi:hypothetical protein
MGCGVGSGRRRTGHRPLELRLGRACVEIQLPLRREFQCSWYVPVQANAVAQGREAGLPTERPSGAES